MFRRDDSSDRIAALEARVEKLERLVALLMDDYNQPSGGNAAYSDDRNGEYLSLLRQGNKIEAIKRYREATNCDLKTAKDRMDELERQARL